MLRPPRRLGRFAVVASFMCFEGEHCVSRAGWKLCARIALATLAISTGAAISFAQSQPRDMIESLNNQVVALYRAGKYSEAVLVAQRALALAEQQTAQDHPSVANSLNNLALLYHAQGRYADAELLLKRSLMIWEKGLGSEHPIFATSLNNLAELYRAQGRYSEAEPLYKRSLAIREKVLGPEHFNVGISLNNLALLYQSQARYADTEPLLRRTVAIFEKALGPDHPDVGTSLNNLAALLFTQGRYADAEPLLKRSLGIREKALGPNHADVGRSLNNLAEVYRYRGLFADAEPLYKRTINIFEKALGSGHPDVGTSLSNLAGLYEIQGRYSDAEPLCRRSLAIRERALGPEHPDVGTALNILAALNQSQGRYADAEPLYKRAIAIYEKALGSDHPFVGISLNNLAGLFRAQGLYADAELHYQRDLAITEKAVGSDHPSLGTSLGNLAALYQSQGRYADAEPLYMRALAVRERALGPEHRDVGQTLLNLSELYRTQGRTAEAEPLFERALAIPKSDIKQLNVLFATNRRREDGKQTVAFSGERADRLSFGRGVLLAAREQVVQRAERRAAGSGLLDRSPAALTSEQVLAIRKIDMAGNIGQLAKGLRSIPEDALIFVHGYNVEFEDALKRTAQIAFDLDYNGVLLAFTWPSSAKLLGYGYDRESARISVNYLIEFLDALAREMPGTRLHVVAHSMGNLVVLSALEKIALRGAADRKLSLGEVILAHPDVDQERFRQLARAAKDLGVRMTLYTSRDDRAMWISRLLSGKDRPGGEPIVVPSVDTIDITGLGARLWSSNHTVYAANPIVFGDMARLIASGERPPDRRTRYFEQVPTQDGAYWRYRTEQVAGR